MMANDVKKVGLDYVDEMCDLAIYAFNAKDTVERRENFECLLNIHGIMAFLIRTIN